jgi:hypothetical protein
MPLGSFVGFGIPGYTVIMRHLVVIGTFAEKEVIQ